MTGEKARDAEKALEGLLDGLRLEVG